MKSISSFSRKGFTLVELMIVIAIIGILAVAIFPQVQGLQEGSRDSARAAALRNTQSALFSFYNDYGHFPTNKPEEGGGTSDATCLQDIKENIKKHASTLPTDPKKNFGVDSCETKGGYGYQIVWGATNSNYILSARVEKQVNANFDKDGGGKPNSVSYNDLKTDSNAIEKVNENLNKKNVVTWDVDKANWYYVIGA